MNGDKPSETMTVFYSSHRDRCLGLTATVTQIPVPMAMGNRPKSCPNINKKGPPLRAPTNMTLLLLFLRCGVDTTVRVDVCRLGLISLYTHDPFSGISMSTHAVSSSSVYLRMTEFRHTHMKVSQPLVCTWFGMMQYA